MFVFGLGYCLVYLHLTARWWFEDDPFQFAFVQAIPNPSQIFTNPAWVRSFTTGHALVPMQILSYWIDVWIGGAAPRIAYIHQSVSFAVTGALLYLILLRILGDTASASVVTAAWMLSPASAVTLQFLATRHYVEGWMFCSAAALCLISEDALSLRRSSRSLVGAVSFSILAVLCKEIYAVFLIPLLGALSYRYQHRRLAVAAFSLGLGYLGYRTWMIGTDLSYGIPLLDLENYLHFLSKLPYTLSNTYAGYVVGGVGLTSLLVALGIRRTRFPAIILCALIIISLAAVFPVSMPLYVSIRFPGPWYRIVALPNALFVLGFLVLLNLWVPKRLFISICLFTVLMMLPGNLTTKLVWTDLNKRAEHEGAFYRSHPNRWLVSEQDAHQFLTGVESLYRITPSHYIHLKDLDARASELKGKELWHLEGDHFVPFVPYPKAP